MRRHALWALGFEATFFLLTLALGTEVALMAPDPATQARLRAFVHRLAQEFAPITAIRAWPKLAATIFAHNLLLMLPILLVGMVATWLAARRGVQGRVGTALAWLDFLAVVLFLFENTAAAGLLIGYVARKAHLPAVRVFATLLPHGVFEIFALSWAFAQPALLVGAGLRGRSVEAAARENLSGLVAGAFLACAVLALAALVEATVSPLVTRALLTPAQARTASASTSTWAPRGREATPTVTRAGRASPRRRA